jgi:hypothetical protein
MRKWSFLTNHAIVLIQIAGQPGSTFRQIASAAGIPYRASRQAVNDLGRDSYIIRKREGREFRYCVNPELQLHKNIECDNSFEDFCIFWKEKRPALDGQRHES